MTIFNVKKYYHTDCITYDVMPYNLAGTLRTVRYIGIVGLIKFLRNSRLTYKSAKKLADKKNKS